MHSVPTVQLKKSQLNIPSQTSTGHELTGPIQTSIMKFGSVRNGNCDDDGAPKKTP